MKYGLLINENNGNIGDDIQAYAESRFLPRVDIAVDRENLDSFKYGNGTEPVALIMGAWFMWHKYRWPPAKQIFPLNVGYHNYDRNKDLLKSSAYALPIRHEHYTGVGGQWFKDYGPVGCRDEYTMKVLSDAGIPNYFSGCVTLTLPKQKETPDKGKYVVLVDLNEDVEKKVRGLIGNNFEIRTTTHSTENIKGATWEQRTKRVEEYLTLYQNAAYVVTRRLHVALPCLAMETPVMVIQSVRMNDPHRFDPYRKWLHYSRNNDFLENGYADFDFAGGTTKNKTNYLETREKLTNTMKDWVQYCEDHKDEPDSFFDRASYTDEECIHWQRDMMHDALRKSHIESKKLFKKYKDLEAKYNNKITKRVSFATRVKRRIRRTLNSGN